MGWGRGDVARLDAPPAKKALHDCQNLFAVARLGRDEIVTIVGCDRLFLFRSPSHFVLRLALTPIMKLYLNAIFISPGELSFGSIAVRSAGVRN